MNKLLKSIPLFAIALMVSTMAVAFDQPSDPGEIEGKKLVLGQPVKVYQLVRNPLVGDNDTSFASADVLLWDTVSDDGVTVNRVGNTDISASSDAVAGVVVGSIPTADDNGAVDPSSDRWKNNWGYIQTYGIALVDVDGSNIAVGEGLRASATANQATAVGGDLTSNGGASLGFAMDASTTTGTIEAFVRTR